MEFFFCRLDFDRFDLAYGDDTNAGFGNSCFAETASIGRSEDYLIIPGAVLETTPAIRATYFCSSSLNQSTVNGLLNILFFLIFYNKWIFVFQHHLWGQLLYNSIVIQFMIQQNLKLDSVLIIKFCKFF